ncbi:hypothetical protein Tco_0835166 [Tanacetum coccineum]
MPVELGSLNVIIGMDWLARYQTVIVCDEKIVRVSFGNETLIIRDDGSNRANESRLNIISYTKTQKYMIKGGPVFLAHVTTKEIEDKSEKKRLEDPEHLIDRPPPKMKELSDQLKELSDKGFIRPSSSPGELTNLCFQKEGRIISNVHRLSRIKQADCKESLSTPKDRRFI